MKYLGIDFGSKRIGLAVSDDAGTMAFPKETISNDSHVAQTVAAKVREWGIEAIILGESKDFKGKDNPINADIKIFKKALEETVKIPVHFEAEFMTSAQAERIQGKNDKIDASAAAIILQSYLDKQRPK